LLACGGGGGGGGGVNATSWPLYPRERGPLRIVQDVGPQGRSGRVQKTLLPPRFDPRTAKPVAGRYTDCAILAHTQSVKDKKRVWSVSGVYCGRCLEVVRKSMKNVIQNYSLRLKFETCSSRYRYFTLFGERSKALPPTYSLYSLCFVVPLAFVSYSHVVEWSSKDIR